MLTSDRSDPLLVQCISEGKTSNCVEERRFVVIKSSNREAVVVEGFTETKGPSWKLAE